MIESNIRYEERLTTIANTRLIYNTMDELEDMLDNRSIHSNGIKRSFITQQKLRSAYRDLRVEVELMTDGIINLDQLMEDYQRTWIFFKEKLYRRANPEDIAIDLLSYCYPPYHREGISTKKSVLFEQIIEENISIPFLVLMLMKAIPGYDSKNGDLTDISVQFERVMNLLERFTGYGTMFKSLPAITRAREEENKSRLMLIYHVSQILETYESYSENSNLYDTANNIKTHLYNLDIVGFWNEYDGKLDSTDFWQIEDALEYGTYFLTHWRKDSENRLTGIRYTLFILEGPDGKLIYYMVHPEAIKHRMKGIAYDDGDHVWYQTEWMDDMPTNIPLQRLMYSGVWPVKINLTRCVDENVVSQYNRWINHDCELIKPYEYLEYEFHPNIYAITRTHIYISSENEEEYYKVPISAQEGFEHIQTNDNVGTMIMNGKTYLVFDELMLYLPISPKILKEYGIEIVEHIE